MNLRWTLVLRLYRRGSGALDVIGVCEDPNTGEQQAFRTQEELWAIVQAKDPEAQPSARTASKKRSRTH